MGRSVAGKRPARAATRPSTHVKRSKNTYRQPDTARSSASSSQSNGVMPKRPDGLHAMWGKPGAMTAKQTGQAIILQYSYVAGSFGVIGALAGAVLEGDSSVGKTFLGSRIGVYFILRGISSVCMTLVGCMLRGYWALSDFEGSSKLKTYTTVLVADWLFGLLVIIAAGICMHDSFFWWLGIISNSVFQLGTLRTISDLTAMAARHKRTKRMDKTRGEEGGRLEYDTNNVDMGKTNNNDAAYMKQIAGRKDEGVDLESSGSRNVATAAAEVSPSAPPLDSSLITTVLADDIEDIPIAPSSPARVYEAPSTRPGSRLLSQREFEEKWLKLRQLSSSTHSCRKVPAVADVKLHLTERNFDVVASGTIEGLTRVYVYQPLDGGKSFLLCELLMSPGINTMADCTCTLTIKVDGSEGSPSVGAAVDALDLGVLLA